MAYRLGVSLQTVCWNRLKLGISRREEARKNRPISPVKVRKQLGLPRPSKAKKLPYDFDLAAMKTAVTEGGYTFDGYKKAMHLNVSRQRLVQIAQMDGFGAKTRTAKWYATRLDKPDLGDKGTVAKLIKETTSYYTISNNLGIPIKSFRRICQLHGLDIPKKSSPNHMVLLRE